MEIIDQDILQIKDETNKKWVKAWKKVQKKINDKHSKPLLQTLAEF